MNPVVNLMITHWGWRNMLRVMGGMALLIGLPCTSTFIQPPRDHLNKCSENKTQNSTHISPIHTVDEESFIDLEKRSHNQPETLHERIEVEQTPDEKKSLNQSETAHQRTLKDQLKILLFPELWFFTVAVVGTSTIQGFYYISLVSITFLK